ncbi:MAG: tetratricopeptide repeat protein [Acidobacteria bacterium]|nr:tetratricopeptide repeat protein [Acidobacteriota bacterium]
MKVQTSFQVAEENRGKRWITAAIIFSLFTGIALASPDPALVEAEELYSQTQYSKALSLLGTGRENTASAYALMGKCYYKLEKYKKATEALEKAVEADPRNSHYMNWLGKAFGKRAETSNFFMAPSYASKARRHFEQAVKLDPANLDAVDDLFDYFMEAPGFLGGGLDKAVQLAERIREQEPVQYHFLLARLAEKKKQWQEAEQHWRKATELAPSDEGLLIGLAKLLASRGRHSESEKVFEQAEQIAPDSARLKFERAKAYIESSRNQDKARKLLEEYLNSSSLTPEDPPRAEAQRLLEKVVSG